jgi:hypothetical protein
VIDEEKIIKVITEDKWMMDILKSVKSLNDKGETFNNES